MRQKSPAYPHVTIEQAIAKARQVYDETKGNPAPADLIFQSMGLSTKGGRSRNYLTSLMQYGLLGSQGRGDSRRFVLTDMAFQIIRDKDEGSMARVAAECEAAMTPGIFQALRGEYKQDVPGSATIESDLKLKHGYTDDAAPVIVKTFRAALEFVGSRGGALADVERLPGTVGAVDVPHEEVSEVQELPMAADVAVAGDRDEFVRNLECGGRVAFTIAGRANDEETKWILQRIAVALQVQAADPRLPKIEPVS